MKIMKSGDLWWYPPTARVCWSQNWTQDLIGQFSYIQPDYLIYILHLEPSSPLNLEPTETFPESNIPKPALEFSRNLPRSVTGTLPGTFLESATCPWNLPGTNPKAAPKPEIGRDSSCCWEIIIYTILNLLIFVVHKRLHNVSALCPKAFACSPLRRTLQGPNLPTLAGLRWR